MPGVTLAKLKKTTSTKPKSKRRPLRAASKPLKAVFRPLKPVGRFLKKASRYIIPPYFRNSWHELRQVTWPSWRESRQLTVAVIIFAVIFGCLVAGVDYGLDKAFKELFLH